MKKLLLISLLVLLFTACEKASDTNAGTNETPATSQTETVAETVAVESETDVPENLAPDFTVLDRAGNRVSLSSLRGKPVVLNFWASWCDPCKREMPDFDAAYKKYGEDVQFMVVNLTDGQSETREVAARFIDAMGYTFPIYFDTEFQAANAYRVQSIPATYFIAADGSLVTHATGQIGSELLEKGIGMILDAE